MALTGNETFQVQGQDANGAPAAETQQVTTGAIGAIAPLPETVAAAGATQGTATAIPAPNSETIVNVTTTLSSEGVKLPVAATGKLVTIYAPLAKGVKVYSTPAGTVINSNTTATTAYAMSSSQQVSFRALSATRWRAVSPAAAGSFGPLTVSGAQKVLPTVVAAAGATQGTATAIPATAAAVVVTTTLSSEGVKLPTASTGRRIEMYLSSTTKGVKVYGGAAGQLINANSTATTAYAMTTNHPAVFYALDTTHWRVLRGN